MASIGEKISRYFDRLKKSGRKPLIGVDIGLSSVKVCKLVPKGASYTLERFAIEPLSEAVIIEDDIQKPSEIADAISAAMKSAGIKPKSSCAVGVSGMNTLVKRLSIPMGSKQEVEDNVVWEMEQYIPFSADDAQISHFSLGDLDKHNKDILACAAKASNIEALQELVIQAGLIPKVVELKVFSLCNYFEVMMNKRRDILKQRNLLIDFGAQTTKVVLLENEIPLLTKEYSLGGVNITEEIQGQMGMRYEEAENLKVSWKPIGSVPENIVPLFEEHIHQQIEELRKILNFYLSSNEDPIIGCFITGGNSQLPGLELALSKMTGTEVYFMDPFDFIGKGRKKYEQEKIEDISARGTTAMGLAMRAI